MRPLGAATACTTTKFWSTRLDDLPDADGAVVLLGANDALLTVPAGRYQERLDEIAGVLVDHYGQAVLVTPTAIDNSLGERIESYRPRVLAICDARAEVECVDAFPLLLHPQHFLDRGHPNDLGYALLADAIAPLVAAPEPASLSLLGLTLVGVLLARLFRRGRAPV